MGNTCGKTRPVSADHVSRGKKAISFSNQKDYGKSPLAKSLTKIPFLPLLCDCCTEIYECSRSSPHLPRNGPTKKNKSDLLTFIP